MSKDPRLALATVAMSKAQDAIRAAWNVRLQTANLNTSLGELQRALEDLKAELQRHP